MSKAIFAIVALFMLNTVTAVLIFEDDLQESKNFQEATVLGNDIMLALNVAE